MIKKIRIYETIKIKKIIKIIKTKRELKCKL